MSEMVCLSRQLLVLSRTLDVDLRLSVSYLGPLVAVALVRAAEVLAFFFNHPLWVFGVADNIKRRLKQTVYRC